ncbi:MAG: radical SAM protein [Candidatus Lokiarchaeota archaeon]|nr:radical SAM protein [Candidatus Lokiarchaeota archaeon]
MESFKKKMSEYVAGLDPRNLFRRGKATVHTALVDEKELGNIKYHLRIGPDGQGTLSINGEKVIYLNQTASDLVRMFIENVPDDEVGRFMTKKYDVPADEVLQDYATIKATIATIVHQRDVCPVVFQGVTPEAAMKSRGAPARVDLALTYRCNNACGHCYVARARSFPEMDTGSWKRVINKLRDIGVPHVTLTGGEATMRDDLADIIQYTQDNNIICGLVTNGIKLADNEFLKKLANAGLDYIQITLESHDPAIHNKMVGADTWEQTVKGLKNAIATDIYTITNTTLCALNAPTIEKTIDFLAEIGLEGTFACNGIIYSGKGKDVGNGIPEHELEPLLDRIVAKANEHGFKFIWYSPTQYCEYNPVIHGLGPKRCSAADISMAIEPNGDVIPCQSYFEQIGNILKDPWGKIWNHKLAKRIRNREGLPQKCKDCDLVETCGGGCPLYVEHHGAVCRSND